MFKVIFLTFLLAYSAEANFWSQCSDLPNALAPDLIISTACPEGATRCTATRGEPLNADVYLTPIHAHAQLEVVVTAFIFGIGINLPPDDDNAFEFFLILHNLNENLFLTQIILAATICIEMEFFMDAPQCQINSMFGRFQL